MRKSCSGTCRSGEAFAILQPTFAWGLSFPCETSPHRASEKEIIDEETVDDGGDRGTVEQRVGGLVLSN